jgi:uncharacterized phiE125 gp8 family phage protein
VSLTLITPPSIEPITLDEAKLHVRVWDANEDGYIEGLIAAARQWCERHCSRSFITTRWRQQFADFPVSGVFKLSMAPVSAVSAITYTDAAGSTQVLSSSAYVLGTDREPAEVRKAYGAVWPSVRTEGVGSVVAVTYDAGYGATAASVPGTIKHAIKLMVSHWYECREPIVTGTTIANVPDSAKSLLDCESWGDYA